MQSITKDELISLKKGRKQYAVVDFYASWCAPCARLAPKFESLAALPNKRAAFYKMDIDDEQDFVLDMGIEKLPTIIVWELQEEGEPKELGRYVGEEISEIENLCKTHFKK